MILVRLERLCPHPFPPDVNIVDVVGASFAVDDFDLPSHGAKAKSISKFGGQGGEERALAQLTPWAIMQDFDRRR